MEEVTHRIVCVVHGDQLRWGEWLGLSLSLSLLDERLLFTCRLFSLDDISEGGENEEQSTTLGISLCEVMHDVDSVGDVRLR